MPGVSICVVDGGEVAWARGYGFADVLAEKEVKPTTLFQAASISKPVASLVALTLVNEGLIGLDDPVNQHLKSLAQGQCCRRGKHQGYGCSRHSRLVETLRRYCS